jgi:adenosine 3'-phospho 5'-phosphosulfate transporter B2
MVGADVGAVTSARPALLPPMYYQALLGAFYGSGIIGCLLVYGLLQERIMSEPYGEDLFKVSVFLVMCNRLVAVVFAMGMLFAKAEEIRNQAPLWKYCAISLSNVGATWCQYEALKYVAFPVQMLGKSFKMMPVMIWGIVISQKRYGFTDWAVAAAVTGGVTEFLMTGNIKAKHSSGTSAHGLILLLVFLGLDGFTSTFQEKLFKQHSTTKYNQMFYVNSFSCLVSLTTLLASGKAGEALHFCGVHPAIMGDALALSAAAVGGQWFIYSQVKEFGALVFAATMNLRQVVSILVSYATYHHHITGPQVLGLLLVFGGLFYKSYAGLASSEKKEEKAPLLPEKRQDIEAFQEQLQSVQEKLETMEKGGCASNASAPKEEAPADLDEPKQAQTPGVEPEGPAVPAAAPADLPEAPAVEKKATNGKKKKAQKKHCLEASEA